MVVESSLDSKLYNYLIDNIKLPQNNQLKSKYTNVTDGSLALIINHLYNHHDGPILIINTDPQMTSKLHRELPYFNPDIEYLPFPDWETLPYDSFSPHSDIISDRIETLYKLNHHTKFTNKYNNKYITSISLTTALYQLCPVDYVNKHSLVLKIGDKINLDDFRDELARCGYKYSAEVTSHGQFNIKGSIIDIFTMGGGTPYRIDLFDDEIETIRTFDPDTQKSINKINHINVLPAHEFPLTEGYIKQFRSSWRNIFPINPLNSEIYNNISEKKIPSGIEYYIPLFFEQTSTIFDYISNNTLIITINNNKDGKNLDFNINTFLDYVSERYQNFNIDSNNPLLPIDKLFINNPQFFENINKFKHIELDLFATDNASNKSWHKELNINKINYQDLAIDKHFKNPTAKLNQFIANNQNSKILLCAESLARKEIIVNLLKKNNIDNSLNIIDLELKINKDSSSWSDFLNNSCDNNLYIAIAKLDNGFKIDLDITSSIIVISESELYGDQIQQRRLRSRKSKSVNADAIVKSLAELKPNQYVVHSQHGIGKYLGLETIEVNNTKSEYLQLLYANNTKLYIPITGLDKISRYSGLEQENIELNKLGTKSWSNAKQKALEKIRDTAAELLGIYAKRAAKKGYQYNISETEYDRFCAEFKFEETPDQELAIKQVLQDMESKNPMDRLVCGDVGFGKTEVALRAAFVAAANNKQTAILVPTTLLAQQHFQNFQDRFANFAINIELLSRFRTPKQQADVIKKLESGAIDIVIGTHKILNSSIKFNNLGLLIIDEEHRFGVSQKDKIKKLRANVDILTLTATPIPRTLNLSLTGIRDLSIITTPPQKRLAIKTFIHKRNKLLISEAINREIKRGGQVYFLHNDIKTINNIYNEVQELFPDCKTAVGHGQMRERELETIMSDFYHRKYQILICTTIIETGIDIPSANTIIIDRADKLGLAQLHQLRGRVGRSHHQAYAYLFIPNEGKISKDAEKRLDAIGSLEDLGAGFTLASHDMEIRGTGNLLGDEQSGHIEAIGYSLYMDLLNKAINSLKSGNLINIDDFDNDTCEVELKESTLLPDDYVPDIDQRLILYKRIASTTNIEELDNLKLEVVDRFGKLPKATENLFIATEIKLKALKLGITKIDLGTKSGKIKFNKKPKIKFNEVINLIQTDSKHYKLSQKEDNNILNIYFPMDNVEQKYNTINNILNKIS